MATLAPDHYGMTIDGESVATPRTFPVVNPATAERFADAPAAEAEHLERAVAAATRAFPAWRDTPMADRKAALVAGGRYHRREPIRTRLAVHSRAGPPAARCDCGDLRSGDVVKGDDPAGLAGRRHRGHRRQAHRGASRAARRRLRDRAVELSGAPRSLEDRPRADGRQHAGAEAVAVHPP